MAERLILGIDPGLASTGWAVILSSGQSYKFIDCGTIISNPKSPMAERLSLIGKAVEEIVARFQPNEVSIEEVFVNNNNLSSLKLGHARGVLIYAAARNGLPVFEYSATNIKKSIVGTGRAEKNQISMMVKILLPRSTPKNEHEADAIACALCHANTGAISSYKIKQQVTL